MHTSVNLKNCIIQSLNDRIQPNLSYFVHLYGDVKLLRNINKYHEVSVPKPNVWFCNLGKKKFTFAVHNVLAISIMEPLPKIRLKAYFLRCWRADEHDNIFLRESALPALHTTSHIGPSLPEPRLCALLGIAHCVSTSIQWARPSVKGGV